MGLSENPMTDETETQLEDLEARYEALNRARLTIFNRLDELEDKVDTLMNTVDTDPQRVSYEQMSREQKVHKIRTALLEQALATNGKAKMGYKEVKALFDNHPSDGHAYDLMEYAGELDGYEYQTSPENRIVVRSDAVNDNAVIHAVNNDSPKEVA